MKNFDKINETVAPYYEQFARLGDLYADDLLSWQFLQRARRVFARQYFFELSLLFRAENRVLRHDYREQRKRDRLRFKQACRAAQARRQAQQAALRRKDEAPQPCVSSGLSRGYTSPFANIPPRSR